jgi:hypothetical protein
MKKKEVSDIVLKVDLLVAFLSFKFLPSPLVFGKNNLNPKLILKSKTIEYRSLFLTRERSYEEIELVDIFVNSTRIFSMTTTNVRIYFNSTIFVFVGNTNSLDKLKKVLRAFEAKNCKLSEKAKALIKE